MSLRVLDSYDDWRQCIAVDCGIPLTKAFVRRRLEELANPRLHTTSRFIEVWGEAHRQRVIEWFERAERELA
ncbi:MAG: hypothetical protein JJT88_17310 [Gammaproteobacteria bacterium]|nr:hypothetical protein [Gammaproteobacteria bacterium]